MVAVRTRLCLVAAFLALQILDLASTLVALDLGLGEGNPLAARAIVALGPVPALLAFKVGGVALGLALLARVQVLYPRSPAPWRILAGVVLCYIPVVWNNVAAIAGAL